MNLKGGGGVLEVCGFVFHSNSISLNFLKYFVCINKYHYHMRCYEYNI